MRSARVDLAAVRWNLARLAADARGEVEVDVSADAFGHGAGPIARVASEAGVPTVLVADESERSDIEELDLPLDVRVTRTPGTGEASAAYGAGPLARSIGLRPALRVAAHVIALKTIDAGEPVSYGYTWRAPRRTTLALVPLGYADGVSRRAGNSARVLLGGALRPVVGRVAMDVHVLDLGRDLGSGLGMSLALDAGPDDGSTPGAVALGDEAVLFGDQAAGSSSVDEWAGSVGMVPLEVTAAIGRRVPRSWS